MLQPFKGFNELSDPLRKTLAEEAKATGRHPKYKFFIARRNPDQELKTGGEYLYPGLYTLSPVTFSITDKGDQKYKSIGLTEGEIKTGPGQNDVETRFKRVTLPENYLGILSLDLQEAEDRAVFDYLELHPKNENGLYRDKNIPAMFTRVDELKEARTRLKHKEMRSSALMVASRLTEPEIRNFTAAMNWNELEDLDVLRDRITEMADKDPEFFRKFIDDPTIESKAVLRRAVDANVIAWIPVENKFVWVSNGSTIAMLDRTEGDQYFERMSDWFLVSKNGPETFKKIKALLAPVPAK